VPIIGEGKLVSSTLFDVGVFLVVVATVLMVLLSLGARGTSLVGDDGAQAP